MSDPAATPVDASSAVDSSSAVDAAAIGNTASIDAAIISSSTCRIRVVAAGLPITPVISASGAVIDSATNHPTPVDAAAVHGASAINTTSAISTASPIDGPTPVGPAPAGNRRHQGVPAGSIDNDRMRLHHGRDSLRRLRHKQRGCRGNCECTNFEKSAHL